MVEFKEKQDKIKAIDKESKSMGKSMRLQFIEEDRSVFVNTITGRAEEVNSSEIPTAYLKQELEFQKNRRQNTDSERIRKKVDKIKDELERRQ